MWQLAQEVAEDWRSAEKLALSWGWGSLNSSCSVDAHGGGAAAGRRARLRGLLRMLSLQGSHKLGHACFVGCQLLVQHAGAGREVGERLGWWPQWRTRRTVLPSSLVSAPACCSGPNALQPSAMQRPLTGTPGPSAWPVRRAGDAAAPARSEACRGGRDGWEDVGSRMGTRDAGLRAVRLLAAGYCHHASWHGRGTAGNRQPTAMLSPQKPS